MKHYNCPTCGFDLWIPLKQLKHSEVGLYDDARFPGRLIIVLKEHYEHFDELSDYLASEFIAEVQQVSKHLRNAFKADRVNVAILGNAEPHVHAHLIPRYFHLESSPEKSPWDDPRPREKMDAKTKDCVISLLSEVL